MIPDYASKMAMRSYVTERIKDLHLALERQNEVSEIQMIRGRIKELRVLEKEIADTAPKDQITASVSYRT